MFVSLYCLFSSLVCSVTNILLNIKNAEHLDLPNHPKQLSIFEAMEAVILKNSYATFVQIKKKDFHHCISYNLNLLLIQHYIVTHSGNLDCNDFKNKITPLTGVLLHVLRYKCNM